LNAVFSLSTDEMSSLRLIRKPEGQVSYLEYLRQHGVTIQHEPVEVLHTQFEGDDPYVRLSI
jgi:hypothetical protein